MKYLVNAFSVNMIPEGGVVAFTPIPKEKASDIITGGDFVSAIGHPDTMRLVNLQLGTSFEANRVNVLLSPGDFCILAQYIGPRLPEGATELPEGAEIRYFTVDVK